jgi:hypothetical protein
LGSDEDNIEFSEFFKKIMNAVKFDMNEDNGYVGVLFGYLNNSENFSLNKFSEVINNLLNKSTSPNHPLPSMVNATPNKAEVMSNKENYTSFGTSNQSRTSTPNQNREPVASVNPREPFTKNQPNVNKNPKIPPKKQNQFNQQQLNQQQNNDDSGEKITFLWLMQHYSAENKAKYDAQKSKNNTPKTKNKPVKTSNKKMKPMVPIPGHSDMELIPGYYDTGPVPSYTDNNVDNNIPIPKPPIPYSEQGTVVLSSYDNEDNGTTVLRNENTTVLGNSWLIRSKNNEKINLSGNCFHIGREFISGGYVINDNTNVGRKHVDILIYGNDCYIEDLNSTNGTFINDNRIAPHQQIKLKDGDVILLANEEFKFIQKNM